MPRPKGKAKKDSPTLRLLEAGTYILCVAGFLYGTRESWVKFYSQPLSATTTEMPLGEESLPSMTVCRFLVSTAARMNQTNITLEEMRSELSLEFVMANQG